MQNFGAFASQLLVWKINNGSTYIAVDLHVTVNNIDVAMEMQQWEQFELLSIYKVFVIAYNNINIRWAARKVADNLTTPGVVGQISVTSGR